LVAPARQAALPRRVIAEALPTAILESRAPPLCHRLREERQSSSVPLCHTDTLVFEQSSFNLKRY
jgi:hypothetical protein